jgi:pyruvate,water dikinase
MSSYTRKLCDVTEDDLSRVGRKTLGLAQLRRAGLPVPDGVCVTTAAFSLVQEALGSEVEDPAAAAARMAAHPLLHPVVDEVAEVYERLFAGAAVAVRSSAILEDLPAASFAGQYETFLNVTGRPALEERLRGCWASVWSPRVLAYCARNGIAHHRIQMAVLIQEMIPADVSGVLFTLNPLTGVDSEMLLEAVWGLGEGLVSGRVNPDQ